MQPTHTALIIPVPEVEDAVGRLRSSLDPSAGWGVPAHVTVLFPFLPPPRIGEAERTALDRIFAGVPRFHTTFTHVEWFGEAAVWLAPRPDHRFRELTAAVWQRFPETPPYEGAHADVVPHLTIGHDAPADALRDAAAAASAHLPLTATIGTVRLIAGTPGQRPWRTLHEFALAQPATVKLGRAQALAELARAILAVRRPHPVRVAIDGCSAAGKTTLADELAQVLAGRTDRAIIRVSIDYFKRLVGSRTAYPHDSPESYYLDSWDNAAIRDQLLRPLGPGGDRRYRTAIMDLPARSPVDVPAQVAPADAVLLADGAFLQRPELDPGWDLRIYLDVSFEEVLRRGTARDAGWMGSAQEAAHRYRIKYIPGERRYVAEVRPRNRAQIVVGNEDPATPTLTVRV